MTVYPSHPPPSSAYQLISSPTSPSVHLLTDLKENHIRTNILQEPSRKILLLKSSISFLVMHTVQCMVRNDILSESESLVNCCHKFMRKKGEFEIPKMLSKPCCFIAWLTNFTTFFFLSFWNKTFEIKHLGEVIWSMLKTGKCAETSMPTYICPILIPRIKRQ